ncbi:MAG: glycoside hydrolase family 88 protein [Bacteroidales bacterium]|nr:glycoside hydrolase family 88 protein [Bacteroidales bacterium]
MKNYKFSVIIFFILLFFSCKECVDKILPAEKITSITNRYEKILYVAKDAKHPPRTINTNSDLVTTDIYDWTSGFFAGNLWYIFELTKDEKWKTEAFKWTEALDTIQYWSGHHDVGFMINCSFGNGLRLSKKAEYKKVLIQAAESLCKRYNPVTKCIKSWDYRKAWDGKTEWFYPVIIDNMMNLELLFEASLLSGNKRFAEIAIQHAETTMKNHYRKDYSCYHVVDYDTLTGKILDKATCQGFTDESAWARGQAWGLYGFTLCYRYTKDTRFLDFAEKIANFIIHNPNLPSDLIPYWDYNANNKNFVPEWKYDASKFKEIPRDASAAAITCSALCELSGYSTKHKYEYIDFAEKSLKSLNSPAYMVVSGKNNYFILDHSVGSIPHGAEIDVPLIYADYYFLEAVLRMKKLNINPT